MRILVVCLFGLLTTGIFLDLDGCASSQNINAAQDIQTTFARAMSDAINKEKRYPYGAMDSRHQGIVTVEFDYIGGGKADNFEIKESSGDPNLDHAALMAVYFATFPPKPPELEGVNHFSVKVNFGLR